MSGQIFLTVEMMRIKFYGTRGSIPVCEPGFQEFGGNTTCLKLTMLDTGRLGILDAGTGIRKLGQELISQGEYQDDIVLGLTHFHWDHIQGFPFFNPAFDPQKQITLIALGRDREINSLEEIFSFQMHGEYFPLEMKNMGAELIFRTPNLSSLTLRGTKSTAYKHNHPGGAYSYRFDKDGRSFAFCTDIEHGLDLDEQLIEFCDGVDVLIHDAQYTDEQLERKRGWGHSSYSQAMEVAERVGASTLIMTHHDPDHDDEYLQAREKECQERFKSCVLAREGMELEI